MVRGLYTAAAGMMADQARLDVISHNLANADTPGYRRDEAVNRSFPEMLLTRLDNAPKVIGPAATGAVIDEIHTSERQGTLRQTGNPFDLAISGDPLFAVRGEDGQVLYTRSGSFALDSSGRLVTAGGQAVLGYVGNQLEEIFLPDGEWDVAKDGTLRGAVTAAGEAVERLALAAGADGQGWQKIGDSLYEGPQPPEEPQNYEVRQGYLEGSNVNPAAEMVDLIAVVRAYEAGQKVIQAVDSTLEKAANEVGRIS